MELKIAILLILITVSNVFAISVYSQATKVSIDARNKTVEQVLDEIENKSEFYFIFNQNQIDVNRVVNIQEDNQLITEIIQKLFEGTNVNYAVLDKQILLTTEPISDFNTFLGAKIAEQQKSVRGRVTDSDGNSLPGVAVAVKGTTMGVLTEANGSYTLNNCPDDAILVFSFVGMVSREIAVSGKEIVDVVLTEEEIGLEEIIVIGYGVVKKVDASGSVAVLDSKSFRDQPVTTVSDAFQGRLSGVQVTNSSVPGGDIKIRIRGASSINRNNDPLYVVDGIVRESGLTGINPDDIKSIQILKDASSTAIYGSRGSNGVILITSKTGEANQRILTFDAQTSFSSIYKKYDMLSAYEFAQAYIDIKGFNPFTDDELAGYQDGTRGVDWQDVMFRQGKRENYRMAVSDGNDKIQYYISGNYISDKGIVEASDYDRYQFRGNIVSDLTKWLKVTTDLNLSHNIRNGDQYKDKSVLFAALNYSPSIDLIDEDGFYVQDPYGSILANPYGQLVGNENKRVQNLVSAMVEFKFTILPSLTFVTTNGIDYTDSKNYSFVSSKVATDLTSRVSNSNTNNMLLQSSNNLTYNKSWGDHSLTATGVFEVSKSTTTFMKLDGTSLLTEAVGYWNINLATSISGSNYTSEWALLSGVSRLMYSFKNKYIITGTFRADGSSKFTKQKWGYFPSFALAWNLGMEEFMKSQDIFQDIKVRASYGIVGNQAINAYETLGLLTQTLFNYGGDTEYVGYFANELPTPDLSWEKTKQLDIGIDFSMLDNHLALSFDYFDRHTVDGLLRKAIPDYAGGGSYWVNAGEISNKGIELNITGRIIDKNDFSFTSVLNTTIIRNKVLSLAGDKYLFGSGLMSNIVPDATILMPGYPVGSFYGYTWTGIDETGKNTFADLNNSGGFDSGDRSIIGDSNPDLSVGLNNLISYKNWDLNVFLNGVFGQEKINLVKFSMCSLHGESRFVTLREGYIDSFEKNPTDPKYASLKIGAVNPQGGSTQWIEDASYVRMENISISYTIPKKVVGFASVRLTASSQNLFTLSKYSGMDPSSFTFSDNIDVNNGFDVGAIPTPRSFTFGVKLEF